MWADPWWVLGWMIVAAVAMMMMLVLLSAMLVLAKAVAHGLAVVRDTRRWNVDRPARSYWRTSTGGTARVEHRHQQVAQVDTGAAVHMVPNDRVTAWLEGNGYRADPPWWV